jgi:hypothetical protein
MAEDEDQRSPAYAFRERGLFWWAHEPMPSQHQTLGTAVIGELKITPEGRIRLDLDGTLNRERHEPFHTDNEAEYLALRARRIFGILRESGRRVLLLDLWNGPARNSSYTFSVEGFGAAQCLIGDRRFDGTIKKPRFSRIEADLKGFEEWLWSNALKVKRGKTVFTARYRKPTQASYTLRNGRLWFLHYLDGSHQTGRHPDLTCSERTYIKYTPSKPLDIEATIEWHRWLQDLMILLTDTDYCLEWPEVKWGKHTCTFYFQRDTSKAERPGRHQCVINFPNLRDNFGAVFDAWISVREKYGSAVYLYSGTRRGAQQYIENRFFMLVSGIEAFHRIKHNQPRMRLKNRIVQMIADLSLGFTDDRVEKFAGSCVKYRNSIAHGGHRHNAGRHNAGPPESYRDYITSVRKLADALSPLYHALLLLEIGLDSQTVRNWVIKTSPAYLRRWALAEAGLIA